MLHLVRSLLYIPGSSGLISLSLSLSFEIEPFDYTMDVDEQEGEEQGPDQSESMEHTEQSDDIHPDMVMITEYRFRDIY